MGLLELPLEIFREVMLFSANVRSLRRALRLRLVNRRLNTRFCR
jgi:hypothetical protein